MDDNNLHNEFISGDEMPVNMPPAGEAWNNMRRKLNEAMPETVGAPVPFNNRNNGLLRSLPLFALGLLLAGAITVMMYSKQRQKVVTNQNSILKTTGNSVPSTVKKIHKSKEVLKEHTKSRQTNNDLPGNNQTFSGNHPFGEPLFKNANLAFPKKHKRQSKGIMQTVLVSRKKIKTTIPESENTFNSKPEDKEQEQAAPQMSAKHSSATNTPDTIAAKNPEPDIEENTAQENNGIVVQAGIQWSLPLPVSSISNYFSGPDASSQPYRLFLPGVWVHMQADKHAFIAEVNPFAAATISSKPFYTSENRIDSVTTFKKTKALNKIFGLSASISYDYNISNNWWIGAGLQGNWWKKGAATINNVQEKKNAPGDPYGTKTFYKSSYTINDSDWTYFSKFQLYTNAEVVYRSAKWQVGVRIGVSFTQLAQNQGPKNLFQSAAFFRLPLVSSKKKK